MEAELDRLRRLYRETGDEHLLDMSTDMGDLTDDAQVALTEELRRRGLTARREVTPFAADGTGSAAVIDEPAEERSYAFGAGIPGIVPGGEPAVEQALEPGGEVRLGMAALITFVDGLELARACEALDEAGIAPAIEQLGGDEAVGTTPRHEVWVEAGELERARAVLRAAMGLFPPPEGEDFADDGAGDGVVGTFETHTEAEQVKALLENERIPATVTSEDEEYVVRVAPGDQERALSVVAARLGLG